MYKERKSRFNRWQRRFLLVWIFFRFSFFVPNVKCDVQPIAVAQTAVSAATVTMCMCFGQADERATLFFELFPIGMSPWSSVTKKKKNTQSRFNSNKMANVNDFPNSTDGLGRFLSTAAILIPDWKRIFDLPGGGLLVWERNSTLKSRVLHVPEVRS